MRKEKLFTDDEFHAALAERYGKSIQRVRMVIIAWGKLQPIYVQTKAGYGQRKGWTPGQLIDAKRFLDTYWTEGGHRNKSVILKDPYKSSRKKGKKKEDRLDNFLASYPEKCDI
jgi:hypothetical protein